MSTLRERQRGSREVCDGRVEKGGDGVHWKRGWGGGGWG